MNPEVTIVIPVYKKVVHFREALESALCQTMPVKIFVIDSSPKEGLFHSIISGNPRVEYLHCKSNLGMAGNWNRCLEMSPTKWVSLLHDDDILLPRAIEILWEVQQRMSEFTLYTGLIDEIDDSGRLVARSPLPPDGSITVLDPKDCALRSMISGTSGTLLDRDGILALGGFCPTLHMTLDWDMWARVSLAAGIVRVNTYTGKYRQYFDFRRGTTQQKLDGRFFIRTNLQYRRNVARLKKRYPDFSVPFDGTEYSTEAAFGALLTLGKWMLPHGRRLAFAYTRRRFYRKSQCASAGLKLFAEFFCWLCWSYSFVRPIWSWLKTKVGIRRPLFPGITRLK